MIVKTVCSPLQSLHAEENARLKAKVAELQELTAALVSDSTLLKWGAICGTTSFYEKKQKKSFFLNQKLFHFCFLGFKKRKSSRRAAHLSAAPSGAKDDSSRGFDWQGYRGQNQVKAITSSTLLDAKESFEIITHSFFWSLGARFLSFY